MGRKNKSDDDTALSREAYNQKMREHPEWVPGWDAILKAFFLVYDNSAYTYVPAQDVEGCSRALEGFGVFQGDGYVHIVTRGLSCIHPHVDAFKGSRSGWGFELTIKWPASTPKEAGPAFRLLDRIAQFMNVQKVTVFRETYMTFTGSLRIPELESDSFAGILFVPDATVKKLSTVHGPVELMQLVNITSAEVAAMGKMRPLVKQLYFNMQQKNPELVVDLQRKESYLI